MSVSFAAHAYNQAKATARFAKAKGAHDELIAAAHRARADALEIEAQAKLRLADEYDAAQERGEVATRMPAVQVQRDDVRDRIIAVLIAGAAAEATGTPVASASLLAAALRSRLLGLALSLDLVQ